MYKSADPEINFFQEQFVSFNLISFAMYAIQDSSTETK